MNQLIDKQTKQLITNILNLMVLQGANYILPLITFPYLVRTLGLETYGLLAFASATIAYFALVTDYGFNLSATRQLAVCRDNAEKIHVLFSAVLIIKVVIMCFSFMILLLLVNGYVKFKQHQLLYLITFVGILGNVLFPGWFFQGMEKMKYLHIGLLGRIFYVVGIFSLVRTPQDYMLVPCISTVINIGVGFVAFMVAVYRFNIKIVVPKYRDVIYQLMEGWYVFSSSLAISVYTISATFILGLVSNNVIVGQFSVANKLVKILKDMYMPFSQALYPFFSRKLLEDKRGGLYIIQRYIYWVFGVMLFFCIILFIYADKAVGIIVQGEQGEVVTLLARILSPTPLLVALSNIYGVNIMLNFNLSKLFNQILIISALFGVIIASFLIFYYHAIGVAVAILLVEILITLAMYIWAKKKVLES